MSYERDVFISYAHIDNAPLTPGQCGWVSLFHGALNGTLSQWLGAQAQIWRDEKLRGNDDFSDEIVAQFPKTAVLVSVLTPRYTKSEWCTREFSEFCRIAESNGGLFVDHRSRVFKVVKTPPDDVSRLPPLLDRMLGYPFYEESGDSAPLPLDPEFGDRQRQEFLQRVSKLAYDIKGVLKDLSQPRPDAPPQPDGTPAVASSGPEPSGTRVFLAECTRDQRAVRDAIESELHRAGYAVLPDSELPRDQTGYVAEIDRLLAQCRLSVHIVGSTYGMVPEGDGQHCVVELQNDAAIRAARATGLKRIIWMPQGLASEHPAQQRFIDMLRTDAALQFGADLVAADVETLKGTILAALKLPRSSATVPAGTDHRHVHVVCDARDRAAVVPLLKLLKARDVEVSVPVFTGDAAEVREANQALVRQSHAVVLYYGAGDETWKYHQEAELRRVSATVTDRPPPARFLLLAEPATADKELIRTVGDDGLIDCATVPLERAIAPLLDGVARERVA